MRFVIVLSAIIISHMINPEVYTEYMDGKETAFGVLLSILLFTDIIEFLVNVSIK